MGKQANRIAAVCVEIHEYSETVYEVVVSPDGEWIASGSEDRTVKVVERKTGRVKCTLTVDSGVSSIAYCPTGDMIAVGCYNGNIHVVDALTAEVKRSVTVNSGFYGVQSVSFSPKGDMIADGCANGKIHFLDAVTVAVKRSLITSTRRSLRLFTRPLTTCCQLDVLAGKYL